jgi:hypothetical protein
MLFKQTKQENITGMIGLKQLTDTKKQYLNIVITLLFNKKL